MRIASFVTAVVLLCAVHPVCAEEPGVIMVRGEGTSEVMPDGVTLQFLIESSADVGIDATAATTAKYRAIVSALVEAGFRESDIRTVRYVVEKRQYPQRNQGEDAKFFFAANHAIEISLADFAQISNTVNVAIAAGATYVTNIIFTSTLQTTKKTEALRLAAEQALASATVLAEAAGGRLGRLVEMQSDDAIALTASDGSGGGHVTSVPIVIRPQPLRFRMNVKARWEMVQ